MDFAYNTRLARKYGTRVVSVSLAQGKFFSVNGTRFSFQVRSCPETGKTLLVHSMVYPDGSTHGAEKMVLLIKGLKPCKDVPYNQNGRLQTPINTYRLVTRLAHRDLNKPRRRRKYEQEKLRAAEAAQYHF